MLSVKCLPTGKWRENCYVVSDECNTTIVIDPGEDAETIIHYLDSEKLDVKAIINTHAHYDHVGAVSNIKKKFGVPFHLHKGDFKLLKQANFYRAIFEGERVIDIADVDVDLSECETLDFGNIRVNIIPTAGHTHGSVSFLIENNLFVGDTIIACKVGRTDLPGSDASLIAESVAKLLELAPETVVYSGHGKPFTIAEIKKRLQENA